MGRNLEVFDGGLMSLWLIDRSIMVSPKTFNDEILFEGSADLKMQMLGITKSKFDNFNVFSNVMEGYDNIYVYAILEDGTVSFPEVNIVHTIGRGDYLAYRSDMMADISSQAIKMVFAYNDSPKVFGDGKNLYEVTASIRDDYKISVYANSSEEALAIADKISISEWRHPDVLEDAHLEDRRIIRHARWGNLSANEIKD